MAKTNPYLDEWKDQRKIVEEKISIKKRVYKLLRKYNLSYGTLFGLFRINDEDGEDKGRATYLKKIYFQFIKEEMN